MKKISMKELKKIELEILIDIDRVCKKHKIKYTLFAGTLIGTIRHKGFIPWDDDIDIAMLRGDYDKFISIYNKEKSKKMDIYSNETNKNYPLPFIKVYNNQTILKEANSIQIDNLGVAIDVFPVDNISIKKKKRRLRKIVLLSKLVYTLLYNDEYYKRKPLYKRIVRGIMKIIGSKFLINKLTKLSIVENNKRCEQVGVLVGGLGERDVWPIEYFENYIDTEFEKKKFKCIKEYDSMLTKVYGDYMKLPPIEERKGSHNIEAYYKE